MTMVSTYPSRRSTAHASSSHAFSTLLVCLTTLTAATTSGRGSSLLHTPRRLAGSAHLYPPLRKQARSNAVLLRIRGGVGVGSGYWSGDGVEIGVDMVGQRGAREGLHGEGLSMGAPLQGSGLEGVMGGGGLSGMGLEGRSMGGAGGDDPDLFANEGTLFKAESEGRDDSEVQYMWEEEERKAKAALEAGKGASDGKEEQRELDSDEEWWEQNKNKFEGINKTWSAWGEDDSNETVVGERFKVGDMVVPRGSEQYESQRMRRLLEKAKNSEGIIDDDEAWWQGADDDQIHKEAIQNFLDETVCCGTGPFTMVGYRFGGRKVRDKDLYDTEKGENETDVEMLTRHFFGWGSNETLMGLHKLHVAVECSDHKEILRLVHEESVDVNGLIDTLGWERAIHFAAYYGDRDTVKLLVELGADPTVKNYYNQTAMHRAAGGGYTALCDDLAGYGVDPLEEDAFTFSPPAWAAAYSKNETTQWFYAKFVHKNGTGFPLGPPPFYGLEQNAGYDWCCPYEEQRDGVGTLFRDNYLEKEDPDKEDKRSTDEIFTERCRMMEARLETMEAEAAISERRTKEIREIKAEKRREMGMKRRQVAMGEFPTMSPSILD